jgi:hypothetical protein
MFYMKLKVKSKRNQFEVEMKALIFWFFLIRQKEQRVKRGTNKIL